MVKLFSVGLLGVASLFSLTASGTVAAIKVECQGNDCQTIPLADVCGPAIIGAAHYAPYAVSCDDTSADGYTSQYPCGSATCEPTHTINGVELVGEYCDDGGGHDAVVMCSTTSVDIPIGVRPVKVECWGDCGGVTMQQVCEPLGIGLVAVGVSCDDTATPGRGSLINYGTCSTTPGQPSCRQYGTLQGSDPLGAYCADGGGYDAMVTCAAPLPASVKAVKVECQGNCNNVVVGDVCLGVGSSKVLQIACDDTATPGGGNTRTPCGPSTTGDAACRSYGELLSTDRLGAYCEDGPDNDVVVTCEM